MKIEDISIVGGRTRPVTAEEVSAAEAVLNVTFPSGYREYVTVLGAGVLGGSLVRIYLPGDIVRDLGEIRQRWDEYWFWDEGHAVLTKQQALECVIIGDTLEGDELIFHPSFPNRLLVLPRNSEMIYEAGTDLFSALDWLCGSGVLTEPFPEREFEPFADETA